MARANHEIIRVPGNGESPGVCEGSAGRRGNDVRLRQTCPESPESQEAPTNPDRPGHARLQAQWRSSRMQWSCGARGASRRSPAAFPRRRLPGDRGRRCRLFRKSRRRRGDYWPVPRGRGSAVRWGTQRVISSKAPLMRTRRAWYPRSALILAAGGTVSSALLLECRRGRDGWHEDRFLQGVSAQVCSMDASGGESARGEQGKIHARILFHSEFLVYNTLMGKRWVSARGAWTRLLNTPLPRFFPMGFGQKPDLYS